MRFKNYQNFMNSGAVYEGPIAKRGQKHRTIKYSLEGHDFVLKQFRSEKEMIWEATAHDLLKSKSDLLLPDRYFLEENLILYDFIPETFKCTPLEAISDWIKIHAKQDIISLLPVECSKEIYVESVMSYVRARKDLYGPNNLNYVDIIERGKNFLTKPENLSVVHGDPHMGNVIGSKQGRAYIDLEVCCVKDPVVDLVSIILYHLDWKDRVVDFYCSESSIEEAEIRKTIPVHTIFRGVKLIFFHNERKIKEEIKLKARNRILKSLDSLLE
jgi:hypothetical protein